MKNLKKIACNVLNIATYLWTAWWVISYVHKVTHPMIENYDLAWNAFVVFFGK